MAQVAHWLLLSDYYDNHQRFNKIMPQSPTNRLGVKKIEKTNEQKSPFVGEKILATYHSFWKKHRNGKFRQFQ